MASLKNAPAVGLGTVLLAGGIVWAAEGNFAQSTISPLTVVPGPLNAVAPDQGDAYASLPIAGANANAASDPTVVSTTSGTFASAAADAFGILSFKGIPYAAPPIGALRWRAPQPPVAGSGVRPATAFGNACIATVGPNPSVSTVSVPQSEDCLTLNIWASSARGTAKPVMVWIHGGGFQFGTSADPSSDGSHLAARDVIVVSINYRLGVFGFLATPQLDQESGTSGMWGMQDQIAALQWVKRNIRQFGGDPGKVTIFGESAGAHSVGMLMTSPKARGLFSKAIVESGAVWDDEHGSIQTHEEALAKGALLLTKFAGQDLRSIPANLINAATPWDYTTDPNSTVFVPSIDGAVLADSPFGVIARRQQADIPVLGGWNSDEWFPFEGRALPPAPSQLFYASAGKLFGERCLNRFKSLYPEDAPGTAATSALKLDGDMIISEQTWSLMVAQTRTNKAWAYRFGYTSAYAPVAIHTSEVPFVFGTLTRQALAPTATPSAADQLMSDEMITYWTNFAKTGDPNGVGLSRWPRLDIDGRQIVRLDQTIAAGTNLDRDRFAFIANYRVSGRLPDAWRTFGSPIATSYAGSGCTE